MTTLARSATHSRPAATVDRSARSWWTRWMRGRPVRRLVGSMRWERPGLADTFTSSRQLPALTPALCDTQPGVFGPPLGTNLMTGQLVWESPFGLYEAGIVTSPNVCILGDLGTAKSTAVKVGLARGISVGGRGVVFDRKRQQGQDGTLAGEYGPLTRAAGGTTLYFHRDPKVGTRINVLDPAILASGKERASAVGQEWLLVLVAEGALGRKLSEFEEWALSGAHRAAQRRADAEGRVPELSDVFEALSNPDDTELDRIGESKQDVIRWGLPVKLALDTYLTGRLSGLIDGPTRGPERPDGTSSPIDFTAPLIVFDTSALELGSVELGVMMAVATAYVMAVWVNVAGQKTVVLEESYSADGLGIVPAAFRDLAKRARGVGASVVSVFHHLSDVPETSPLRSLIKEASIVMAFRQQTDEDARQVIEMLGLDEAAIETLTKLPRGVHLRKVGTRPATFLRLVRTPTEERICYTDTALHGQGES